MLAGRAGLEEHAAGHGHPDGLRPGRVFAAEKLSFKVKISQMFEIHYSAIHLIKGTISLLSLSKVSNTE